MRNIPDKVKEIQTYKLKQEAGAKSISFSQLSVYLNCPKCWERAYLRKEQVYQPSIHTAFGTAFHETLQNWLGVLYNNSVKAANSVDLHKELETNLIKVYKSEREKYGKDFSDKETLNEFYEDGVAILDYIVKNRKTYFPSNKSNVLVGCEVPIYVPLRPGMYFKGFIDVLTYDLERNVWKIWDIKTSTSSWSAETKADRIKTSQVIYYREFLSEQFSIPVETIEIEYFIVKRKIPEDAEFASMRRRVQEFVPNSGPRITKQILANLDEFCCTALTGDGSYVDKDYPKNPSVKNCKYCLFRDTCVGAQAAL